MAKLWIFFLKTLPGCDILPLSLHVFVKSIIKDGIRLCFRHQYPCTGQLRRQRFRK